jgi:hypothetical protein
LVLHNRVIQILRHRQEVVPYSGNIAIYQYVITITDFFGSSLCNRIDQWIEIERRQIWIFSLDKYGRRNMIPENKYVVSVFVAQQVQKR